MNKTRNIFGWVMGVLITALFLFSASLKLMGGEEMAKNTASLGLIASQMQWIGVIEIVSVLLFIIPRTGLLGTLLLAAYLGGAIATQLEHAQSIVAPCVIQAFVWVTALVRFPELGYRIAGRKFSLLNKI